MDNEDDKEQTIPTEPNQAKNVVTWDVPYDPENPVQWSTRRKWGITLLVSMITVNVTFASSAPTAVTKDIAESFHVSPKVANLVTTLFLLGYITGPLIWGPFSELVGRRPIFRLTLSVYTIFYLGQALAPNIQTFLVTRFFAGFFAVGPLTVCGGVIADIWSAAGRGPATSLYSGSMFLGPVCGPIIGGFIADSSLNWRWVFWVMMMYASACSFMTIFLPETYTPVLLVKKARRIRKANSLTLNDLYAEHEMHEWSVMAILQRTVYRPIQMLQSEPILVLVTCYTSTVYGVLYLLFEAIPFIFVRTRGLSDSHAGLIFIGVGIGSTFGAIINALCARHYPTLIVKWKGYPPPEERLYGAMIGAPQLVVGSFWLGWTGNVLSIPWYVPAISTIFIGISISAIFMSFNTFLVDTFLIYSASALAANVIIRSITAAAMPLFTVQMYSKLGINWASTLIGILGIILIPIPFVFHKYGARIRSKSRFAPCMDLKIAQEMRNDAVNRPEAGTA